MRKKIIIAVIACFILLWQYGFRLEYLHDRDRTYTLSDTQKTQVREATRGMSETELLKYSVKYASSTLAFYQKEDISKGHANCIGYATMCSAVFNYAAKANNLHGSSKPVVGYVTFCGINLCNLLRNIMPTQQMKSFVKNHDFVEFCFDKETVYADACAYDLMLNDCKTRK